MSVQKQPSGLSDRIFAISWLLVCAIIIYQMWSLKVPFVYEPVGPKPFPLLLAGLMVICCGVLVLNPDRDIQWPETPVVGKGLLLMAVLLGYAALFETLGFPIATMLMSSMVARLFGGRWMTGLLAGLAIGLLGYLLFDRVLQVTLPLGLMQLG